MPIGSEFGQRMLFGDQPPSQMDLASAGIGPMPLSMVDVEFYPKMMALLQRLRGAQQVADSPQALQYGAGKLMGSEPGTRGFMGDLYRSAKGYTGQVQQDVTSNPDINLTPQQSQHLVSGQPPGMNLPGITPEQLQQLPGTRMKQFGPSEANYRGDQYSAIYNRSNLQNLHEQITNLLNFLQGKTGAAGGGAMAMGAPMGGYLTDVRRGGHRRGGGHYMLYDQQTMPNWQYPPQYTQMTSAMYPYAPDLQAADPRHYNPQYMYGGAGAEMSRPAPQDPGSITAGPPTHPLIAALQNYFNPRQQMGAFPGAYDPSGAIPTTARLLPEMSELSNIALLPY